MEMPTTIEGKWALLDANGKELVTQESHPGAKLVLVPHFYSGQYSQTLTRTTVVGTRGRKARVALKVGASTGQVKAESMDRAPKTVEPAFDKTPQAKTPPPEKEKPGEPKPRPATGKPKS